MTRAGEDRCQWGGSGCRGEAVGHMHYMRERVRLCAMHLDPKQHPPDMRAPERFCVDEKECSGF